MGSAFIIVTIYLLLVGVVLFVICMVGGKKNNLSPDYDQYAEQAEESKKKK